METPYITRAWRGRPEDMSRRTRFAVALSILRNRRVTMTATDEALDLTWVEKAKRRRSRGA